MSETSSISAVLRERASLQPNDTAFTFMNYDKDWEGVPETLTWAEVYRKSRNLAHELRSCAATGDRAVILAPQGLEYIIAFLASLEAGVIAVPLSTPMMGQHDERVIAVMRDANPTAIFTTSAIVESVRPYAVAQGDGPVPTIFEVDQMDLDTRRKVNLGRDPKPATAYLQYTSGSTRTPAGVMVSTRNLSANYEQQMADYFPEHGGVAPTGTTVVSWLPFYHDMGLMLGVAAPILGGWKTVFMTPIAFLQRPARWVQLLGSNPNAVTAAPNFAFDLAAARTKDEDMAGRDLGSVAAIISGAERVHVATLRRFVQRFSRFNLQDTVLRPSYGLAEATLYVATHGSRRAPGVAHFEPEKMAAGHAERRSTGTALVSYGIPNNPPVRIVNPETRTEMPAGMIGEIWTQGENVALGYWNKPDETEHTFNGVIVDPSSDISENKWLRTGDLGFISEGEMFIIGRMKDLLIVRGRNHYPDDIESTTSLISNGRVAAIADPTSEEEQLVVIAELKRRMETEEEFAERINAVKAEVTAAISRSHGIGVADLVIVEPGALPITTSGKIRRSGASEKYRKNEFRRLAG
jgi:acyl-CoA synthetase (AMP-forming)/AMP-acid ligase II